MPYPGNTARAVFEFELPNGTPGFVTPHFRTLDGHDFTQGDVEDLATLLADWASNADFQGETNVPLMNFGVPQVVLQNISVTSLQVIGPPQHVLAVNDPGNAAGLPLPNETAIVVTLYTGIVGRRFRGRNFWPLTSTTYMEADGTLAGATVTALQDTFDALIAGLVTEGTFVLAVHSEVGAMVNQVTSCIVRDTLHHQRRRNQ